MENKYNCAVMVRCSKADHESLKELAGKLSIPAATVARFALRRGLQIVASHGIQIDTGHQEETRP